MIEKHRKSIFYSKALMLIKMISESRKNVRKDLGMNSNRRNIFWMRIGAMTEERKYYGNKEHRLQL